MSSNITVFRRCEYCQNEFTAKTSITRFCSPRCNKASAMAKARALKLERSHEQTIQFAMQVKKPLLEKELLTIRDVAELLGISKQAVYLLIQKKNLGSLRISQRNTRVSKDDFQLFLSNRLIEPITLSRQSSSTNEVDVLTRDACYSVPELTDLFNKSRGDLYVFLKRAGVSKVKIKKEVFFSKAEIDRLFRKFTALKMLGHDKERAANALLSKKGFDRSHCYSMEECELLFKQKRGNLYNKFSLRQVPKIREGHSVFYLKKAIDKIYRSLERGREFE